MHINMQQGSNVATFEILICARDLTKGTRQGQMCRCKDCCHSGYIVLMANLTAGLGTTVENYEPFGTFTAMLINVHCP